MCTNRRPFQTATFHVVAGGTWYPIRPGAVVRDSAGPILRRLPAAVPPPGVVRVGPRPAGLFRGGAVPHDDDSYMSRLT
jgi:hypothetical protein